MSRWEQTHLSVFVIAHIRVNALTLCGNCVAILNEWEGAMQSPCVRQRERQLHIRSGKFTSTFVIVCLKSPALWGITVWKHSTRIFKTLQRLCNICWINQQIFAIFHLNGSGTLFTLMTYIECFWKSPPQ